MKCKTSDWGCVYHACMSDDCQKRYMSKKQFGKGRCEVPKPVPVTITLKPQEMENIKTEFENETREETMKYIESKRNWDVANQRYRILPAEESKIERTTNLSDCKIYWRGEYLLIETQDLIHYWDSFPHCFLKQAVEFIEPEKPAKWKTIDVLIRLRMGIRQTEVNCCGYVEDILEGKEMTKELYEEFMRKARAQDLQHHGSHTF